MPLVLQLQGAVLYEARSVFGQPIQKHIEPHTLLRLIAERVLLDQIIDNPGGQKVPLAAKAVGNAHNLVKHTTTMLRLYLRDRCFCFCAR